MRRTAVGDNGGPAGCDDGPMAFSELSHPWRASDHSNPRGTLLLCHGFTGTPQSLRPWAEDHAARGWRVELPLLPGHARTWQDLAGTRWEDWYGHVRSAAIELSDRHGPIAVGGLSMGGTLSLALAADQELRGRIAALTAVNPGLTLPPLAYAAEAIAPLIRTLPGIGSDIALAGAEEEAYDRMPVRAVAQLRQLFARTRRALPDVTAPLLLVTSPLDHTVPARDSDLVAARVRGPVQRLSTPRSYHLVPLDHDAELLFTTSSRFLDRYVPNPTGGRS